MTYHQTSFAAALAVRRRSLNALKGITVMYCTDTAEIPVLSRPGKTVFRQMDQHGLQVMEYRRDFLIEVSQLVDPLTGRTFSPLDGHRIKEPTAPGQFVVYEIRPVGSEPAARYSDTTEQEWRIHTLRCSEEPTP